MSKKGGCFCNWCMYQRAFQHCKKYGLKFRSVKAKSGEVEAFFKNQAGEEFSMLWVNKLPDGCTHRG